MTTQLNQPQNVAVPVDPNLALGSNRSGFTLGLSRWCSLCDWNPSVFSVLEALHFSTSGLRAGQPSQTLTQPLRSCVTSGQPSSASLHLLHNSQL